MRTKDEIQDIQHRLYQFHVWRGRFLKDVPYDDLAREVHLELYEDAVNIHLRTQLVLKRVERQGKKVWRFMNRNGL